MALSSRPSHEPATPRKTRGQACVIVGFNGDTIELVPKGLHIISGNGRVDLKLGFREIMIIGQDGEEEWIFAERNGPGKSRQFQFNKDNFEKILQEYLEAA
jgi:hypothetical protein